MRHRPKAPNTNSLVRILRTSCFWMIVPFLFCGAGAQTAQKQAERNERATPCAAAGKVDSYLRQASSYGFSGAVLILAHGERCLNSGYGFADRRSRAPVSDTTVLDIGSNTKQFTATAILKLEMQGLLSTEDRIGKYLVNVPPDKSEITIHEVLNHTAGFGEYSGDDYDVSGRDETIQRILATPLLFAPGTEFSYSNAGYSVLAAIIEKVSGQFYEVFLRKQLFEPAGMLHTGYRIPVWTDNVLAHGYVHGIDRGTPLDYRWSPEGPYWNLLGNGGLLSTTTDISKWFEALKGNSILSENEKRKMFTAYRADYGYGWTIEQTSNGQLVRHLGGNSFGFSADSTWYRDKDLIIVVLSNAGTFNPNLDYSGLIETRITRLVLGEEPPPRPSLAFTDVVPDELNKLKGTYRLPSGGTFRISLTDRLTLEPVGQDAVNLVTVPDRQDQSVIDRASEKSDAIVKGFKHGDYAPLQRCFRTKEVFERMKEILQDRWHEWESSDGPQRGFEMLGTVRSWWSSHRDLNTFIRVNFQKQNRVFRFHWDSTATYIDSIGGEIAPNPAPTLLNPISKTEFWAWQPGVDHSVRFRFKLSKDSKAGKNVIQIWTKKGILVARPIPGH